MNHPYDPTTSFDQVIDTTLPMLPGEIGPTTSTTTIRVEASATPCTETVTLPRVIFSDFEEEDEIMMEDLKTMILERPSDPYADWTKKKLYRRAKELGVPGRGSLNKADLRKALIEFEGR